MQCVVNSSHKVIVDMPLTMPALKNKVLLLLTAVAAGGGLLVVCFGQSAPNQVDRRMGLAPPSLPSIGEASPTLHGRSKEKTGGRGDLLFGKDSDFSGEYNYDSDTGVYSTVIRAFLFVAVLGAAAFYVSKKLLPKITNLPGKEVRVVETVYLGPRKAVHVLEVGSRRFLVGSTNENITKLADITNITGNYTELPSKEVSYN